ncbi:hypothetical protein VSR68_37045 [Paraburkholderia phymatum]|uniref:hypothetical protein n=1 Tax=Paraburkholderia phymatum TaxID=148447 RepID=UPI00317EED92
MLPSASKMDETSNPLSLREPRVFLQTLRDTQTALTQAVATLTEICATLESLVSEYGGRIHEPTNACTSIQNELDLDARFSKLSGELLFATDMAMEDILFNQSTLERKLNKYETQLAQLQRDLLGRNIDVSVSGHWSAAVTDPFRLLILSVERRYGQIKEKLSSWFSFDRHYLAWIVFLILICEILSVALIRSI